MAGTATPNTATPNTAVARFVAARDALIERRSDYARACAEFSWPVSDDDDFNWAIDYFDGVLADPAAESANRSALRILDDTAEGEKEVSFTFAQLSAASSRTANFLRGLGLQRGDRLLLMLGNTPALWEIMLGAFKLGIVIIPASTLLTEDDLADRLSRGNVRAVATSSEHVPQFTGGVAEQLIRILTSAGGSAPGWANLSQADACDAVLTDPGVTKAKDSLLLYFTSGTTAAPKLVEHSHRTYPVGHLSTLYWIGLKPGDVHLNISSPGWAKHAWSTFFAPWNAGATVFIFNPAGRFNAGRLLDVLGAAGVTTFCAPPTVYRMLIQEDLDAHRERLSGLRELVGAGEPLNPEVISQFETRLGLTIRDGFGQTETTAQVGNSPGQPLQPGSMGRPLPGYHVCVAGPNGELMEDDEVGEGELCLHIGDRRPGGLMVHYCGNPEKTAEVMRGGHYRTGDVVSRDERGYLTYVGRADDVFKSSDYRISPFELESVLIECDAVAEAAVVPSPHPTRLSVPKAYIALAPGHEANIDTAREIFAFSHEKLAAYKRVRRLEFFTLPKTVSGKIRRVELRKREEKFHGSGEDESKRLSSADFWEADVAAKK